jgi:hypothetical protein
MSIKIVLLFKFMILIMALPAVIAQNQEKDNSKIQSWYVSFQYLGLTYHPDGGNTPEIYPLKLDKKAFLVVDVGVAANIDYRLCNYSFLRFSTSYYKDCAFVNGGCFHFGPRFQFSWKKNSINIGMGPILSLREDWHRFSQYTTDDFYGNRVYKGWQYRLFPYALELEYLRKINDKLDFQYSIIPGAPLVITSLFGVRFKL